MTGPAGLQAEFKVAMLGTLYGVCHQCCSLHIFQNVSFCGGCGLTGHKFKGTDGVRICPNKKKPAPHDSVARASPLN